MNERPRVLFYVPTPPPYAGPEVANGALLDGWRGDTCELLHVRANIRDDNARKGILDWQGLWRMARNYLRFLAVLISKRPPLVYLLLSSGTVGYLRDALLIATAKLFRRKVIAHYRGGNFHGFYNGASSWLKRIICWSLKRTDRVIVQARCLAFMFDGLVDEKRIAVLYNGIDLKGVPCRERNFEKPVTFLFMGHVAHSKGLYDLIQAYKEVRQTWNIRLLIAGRRIADPAVVRGWLTGEHLTHYNANHQAIEDTIDRFLEQATDHGAEYLGVVPSEEKFSVFDRADCLVLPSYTEGFSMTVLEAMTAGMPVIVTKVGAFPEVVVEGQNGWLLEPGQSAALAKTMSNLLDNPQTGNQIGASNRSTVESTYAIPKIRQQLETLLLDLVRSQ